MFAIPERVVVNILLLAAVCICKLASCLIRRGRCIICSIAEVILQDISSDE